MDKIVNITNGMMENTIFYCQNKARLLTAKPHLSRVKEKPAETDNDVNLIENAAIFSTIYQIYWATATSNRIYRQFESLPSNDDMFNTRK